MCQKASDVDICDISSVFAYTEIIDAMVKLHGFFWSSQHEWAPKDHQVDDLGLHP